MPSFFDLFFIWGKYLCCDWHEIYLQYLCVDLDNIQQKQEWAWRLNKWPIYQKKRRGKKSLENHDKKKK